MSSSSYSWDDAVLALTTSLLQRKRDESVQRKWLRETVSTTAASLPPPTIPWDHLDPHHCAAAFERAPPRTAESYMAHLTDTWCSLVATAIADVEAEAAAGGEAATAEARRRRLIVWLLRRVDPPRMGRLLARAKFVELLVDMVERRQSDAEWIVAEVAAHIATTSGSGVSSGSSSSIHTANQIAAQQGGSDWTTIKIERRTNADGTTSTTTSTRSAPPPAMCPCCRGRLKQRGLLDQFLRALVVAAAHQQQQHTKHKWSVGGAALLRAVKQTWPKQANAELVPLSAILRPLPPPLNNPWWPPFSSHATAVVWCGECE